MRVSAAKRNNQRGMRGGVPSRGSGIGAYKNIAIRNDGVTRVPRRCVSRQRAARWRMALRAKGSNRA